MKFVLGGTAAFLLGAAPALAGGIERAPQSLSPLFEKGDYVELSFGGASPSVQGVDVAGNETGDIAQGFGFGGFAYKHQFNDKVSGAIIVEQPFGSDMYYDYEGPGAVLAGSKAVINSTSVTALARYHFNENLSVHGGWRSTIVDAKVNLGGAAFGPVGGPLNGYQIELDREWGFGYVIGAAYELPEIAARVSVTYNSKIAHDFDSHETVGGVSKGDSVTKVNTPESVNIDFQSGVAADTLVFGSIRWVNWSEFKVQPEYFSAYNPVGLATFEDTTTYTLGVARKFTDNWSGAASFAIEPKGSDLVSALAPVNGRKGISLAAIYTQDKIKVTTGITYSRLGDATPQVGGQPAARTSDNDVWGAGVKIGYSF